MNDAGVLKFEKILFYDFISLKSVLFANKACNAF